jgi:hypothetical protein
MILKPHWPAIYALVDVAFPEMVKAGQCRSLKEFLRNLPLADSEGTRLTIMDFVEIENDAAK